MRPQQFMDMYLVVGPSQIEQGNMRALPTPFPKVCCANIRIYCKCFNMTIQLTTVHYWTHFSFVALYNSQQRNQVFMRPQSFLRVANRFRSNCDFDIGYGVLRDFVYQPIWCLVWFLFPYSRPYIPSIIKLLPQRNRTHRFGLPH